ncbi:H-type lectin domain-containing protein [Streptomyces sp. NPDC020412]|uniref:H-type lectin domain-containing protein n=1 Tax=Streptomyces sp. NPDC020412 TaxID=3365073 RepID=UPI00378E3694
MMSTLADTGRVYRYDGSAWVPISALVQRGSVSVSFTGQTSYTTTVTFPIPFPTTPSVSVNINYLGAPAARWGERAGAVTATNFSLTVFSNDPAIPSTWSGVDVQWTAVAN